MGRPFTLSELPQKSSVESAVLRPQGTHAFSPPKEEKDAKMLNEQSPRRCRVLPILPPPPSPKSSPLSTLPAHTPPISQLPPTQPIPSLLLPPPSLPIHSKLLLLTFPTLSPLPVSRLSNPPLSPAPFYLFINSSFPSHPFAGPVSTSPTRNVKGNDDRPSPRSMRPCSALPSAG